MDLARYSELFLTESREHLSAINHLLLEMERAPRSTEPVAAIFRAVHTVKGMSATMGYRAVAELTHEMETVLDHVRRGAHVVTPQMMDAFFEAADTLESAIELSVQGRADTIAVGPLLERLRALGALAGELSTGTIESAPAAPVVFDSLVAGAREAEHARLAAAGSRAPTVGLNDLVAHVRMNAGTPLRGVRAFLIVKKAESLGRLISVTPPVEVLQAEGFDREFAIHLETAADYGSVERTIRAMGDVEHVDIRAAAAAREVITAGETRMRTSPNGKARATQNVRIDLRRLDKLMNLIGELVITRGRLAQLSRALDDGSLDEAVAEASRLISDLQDEIMASRMVPVWQVFDRFPRLVRDAARSLGKQIEFSVEGKEINLDRSMLDEIGDPLVHLLRNAVDHGIEVPAVRVAAGKAASGKLVLTAARERSSITIRVSDDGRGIDRHRVLQKARKLGLVDAAKTELSDDELIRLISRPGFSTAESVTDISGRGVGIDAVNARIRAVGGSVEIKSVPDRGTTVTLRLPLTLAILRALLVRVAGETYAVPMAHINETVELEPGTLRTVKGHEVLVLRDDVMPLVRFRSLLRLPVADDVMKQVIVLEVGERRAGLVVDELAGQQDIVVKQFDAVRNAEAMFSGATILGDGAPALIVDVGSLL